MNAWSKTFGSDVFVGSTILASFGTGLAIGWLISRRYMLRKPHVTLPEVARHTIKISPRLHLNETVGSPDGGDMGAVVPADTGDHKLVIVVRNDLKMGKGKVAAQCSHAAVAAVENSIVNAPDRLAQWKMIGQPKVVVKVDSDTIMQDLQVSAKKIGLTTSVVRDAGRTQVAPGTATVLAIGPGPSSLVDSVTSNLRLL